MIFHWLPVWAIPALSLCLLIGGIIAVVKNKSSNGGLFCIALGASHVLFALGIYVGNQIHIYFNMKGGSSFSWIGAVPLILGYSLPFVFICRNGIRKLGRHPSFGRVKKPEPPNAIAKALPEKPLRGKDRIFEVYDEERSKIKSQKTKPKSADLKLSVENFDLFMESLFYFFGLFLLYLAGLLISVGGIAVEVFVMLNHCTGGACL